MFFIDPRYIFFVMIPTLIITLGAQWWVKSAYRRASQVPNMQRVTGAQAARVILDSAGLNYIPIQPLGQPGLGRGAASSNIMADLNDFYDPGQKTLNLSSGVYMGTSVAALAVAAHEAGHAIQDAKRYGWMQARTAIVPAVNIGSNFGLILVIVGLVLQVSGIAWLGVGAFALGTLFAFLTLPVELNASTRAMQMLTTTGLVSREEYGQARSVLTAAAFTYIAGLATSILNLLYWVMLVSGMGGRSRD